MFVLPTQQEKPNQQKPRDAIMANQEKIFKTNTKRRVTTERIAKYTSVRIVRKSLANHHSFVSHDDNTTTLIENDYIQTVEHIATSLNQKGEAVELTDEQLQTKPPGYINSAFLNKGKLLGGGAGLLLAAATTGALLALSLALAAAAALGGAASLASLTTSKETNRLQS